MQALSDEQQIDRLEKRMDRFEKKLDDGFTGTRGEIAAARGDGRADIRLLLGVLLTMFMAMILGFAGIVAGILLQLS